MIYLKLFITFLEIGTVSFGGGYGMISLVREKVLENAWLTEEELLNIIAVAESTPGPIAVNMATFVGANQGGFFGSLCSTLGVVLPSFVIILIIASILKNILKYKGVNAFLTGVRPCVSGLIIGTAITMLLSKLLNLTDVKSLPEIDVFGIIIFIVLIVFGFVYKKVKKAKPSPILMILISAFMGLILYAIENKF